ncbi:MAG: hypothetical protein NZ551_00375 [Microscillaceae bacterium]|nr:hypothetical protein [Microscillaceae bacterium]MDW8459644.1 hypothetical protein [Cytophagales bacterium]
MKIISFIVQNEQQVKELLEFAQKNLGIQPAQVKNININTKKRPMDMIRRAKEQLRDEFEKDF